MLSKLKFSKEIIAITFLFFSCINGSSQTAWKTFNHKNGFSIQLPNYFSEGILVAAGTLQWFSNKIDKDIQLTVETFGNGNSVDLKQSYLSDLNIYKGISYKIFKPTWYVISGQNDEGVFYNKSILRNGVQHHLRITYPPREKILFDTILDKISSSFK